MGHRLSHPSHDRSPRLAASSSNAVLEKELAWFFTEAEIASSLPSNFDVLNATALSGRRGLRRNLADVSADDRMDAACAAGTIERRLRRMGDPHAGVLSAAFEPRVWPELLEAELGPLTGIVVRLAAAGRSRRATDQGCRDVREREAASVLAVTVERDGPIALGALLTKARALYSRALRAYAKVRGLGPSVVPATQEEEVNNASES